MRIDGPQLTSSLSLNGTTITDLNVFATTASLNSLSGSTATTGSNLFKGTQTISGSIIPAVNNIYDLGSPTQQFRHVYISTGSLYIDGTKVLGSTAQELQITTDVGQSFKILETGSDSITLQSVDGNITLTNSGGGDVVLDPNTGVIQLKGPTTIYAGYKFLSSDGNSIHFGNGIAVTGSIVSTVTPLVSGSAQISYTGLSNVPSGIVSGSSQLTSSYDSRYVLSGSITQTTWDNIANKPVGITSGSSQIDITGTTGYSTFSSSISNSINTLSGSIATTTLGTKNRVDSIEAKTGSYTTTGSNIFIGNQTITGSGTVTGDLTVQGSLIAQQFIVSSSVTYLTTSFSSGSTKFGDSIDDTHQFTGSVNITGSLNISGGIISTVTPLVSGSNQISYTGITNIPSGIISGSNQLPSGIVSSSAQTIANLPAGTVSGSSQVIYSGLTGIPSGIISGSAQLPSGVVSGSSQVLNGTGIFSGSAQLPSGIVSGSVQIIDLGFATTSSVITASSVRNVDTFTATANQSTFTSSQGYSVGLIDVFVNGSKLAASDYVALNGTSVLLNVAAEGGETVELYAYFQALNSNNALRTVTTATATASQTVFTGITYTQGLIEVYYNGSRLSASEYTATNGTSVTLSTAANVGDILDFIAYNYTVGAFVGLSGTGTANYLPKYASTSSLTNSSIIDNSGVVTINGTLVVTGTTLVSGSSQISYTGLSNIPSGIVSGSAQIPSLLPSGVVSGSAQTIANLPSGTVSGSVQVDVMSTTNIARLATTGSNTFQGLQTINGNLVVTGSLTAQQFIVSSSVTYMTTSFASGSTRFGDSSDDNHDFTGSVRITGSLTTQGGLILGNSQTISPTGSIGYNNAVGVFIYGKSGSEADFRLYNRDGLTAMSVTSGTQNVSFNGSVTTGGDITIPNGNYYYAKRNTGGASINILGFASASDTLTLKGGTSGAGNSINFEDTGGIIASFYNGRLGIGTSSSAAILRPLSIKPATDIPQLYLVQSNNDAGGWMMRAGVDGHYHLISYQGSESEKLTIRYDTNAATFTGSVSAGDYLKGICTTSFNGDGIRVYASATGSSGSQPGIGYWTAAGSKRFINQLDVGGDTWALTNATGVNLLLAQQSGALTLTSSTYGFPFTIVGQNTGYGSSILLDAGTSAGGKKYSVMSSGSSNGAIAGNKFAIYNMTDDNYPFIINSNTVAHPLQPAFKAGMASNTSFAANATIVFTDTGGNHFNIGGCYSTSTGLFTAPVAGRYIFSTCVIYQSMSAGQAMDDAFYIYKNSSLVAYSFRRSEYEAGYTGNGGYYTDHANILLNLAAGDTVSIRNNRALDVHGNTNYCFFYGYMLG